MTLTPASRWQELARRTGTGIEVALLWNESGNRVKVAVSDERLCHHVDLELDGSDAPSAFRDPFADAASRLLAAPLPTEWDWGRNS